MKKIFLFILIMFIPFMINAEELKMEWQKSWGGDDDDIFSNILQTTDGGFVAYGYSYSTDIEGLPNKGSDDAIIVRYDKDGNMLWQKSWGGDDNDFFKNMLQTTNGGFVAVGYYWSTDIEGLLNKGSGDAIIVKYDQDGNMLWQKSLGGNGYDYFDNILQTPDGNFVAVGYYWSTDIEGLPNKGCFDAIIVKYDKDGNMLWQKSWGGNDEDSFSDILQTTDGNFVAVGYSYSTDIEGLPNKGSNDAIIVKYDKDGNMLWQKSWGGNYSDGFNSALLMQDGGIITTGQSSSNDIAGVVNEAENKAAIIVKYDKDGNLLWQDSVSDGSSLEYSSMALTKDDGIIVTVHSFWEDEGIFYTGEEDAMLIKYDKNGNTLLKKIWGGSEVDVFYKLILTDDNSIIVSGLTFSDDIEGLPNKGQNDAIIVKYSINYDIKTSESENGTYTLTQQGSKGIITVNPNEKYEVDQIVIKDKEGNMLNLEVTKQEDGTYSFELFTDVSVEVLYKEKIENPKTGILDVMTILIIGFIISVTGIFIVKNYNERYEM